MAQTATKHIPGASKAYCIFYSLFSVLAPLSFVVFITGGVYSDYTLVFCGIMLLFFANVVYGFLSVRDRLLFLFLHFGISLFLLSRPLIAIANNQPSEWLLSSGETTMFALQAIYLSMMCLLLATCACSALLSYNASCRKRAARALPLKLCGAQTRIQSLIEHTHSEKFAHKMRYFRAASLVCFVVCVIGAFYAGSLKLAYMDGRVYTDYYLVDASSYTPWIIGTLETMTPFMLAAYLATMPRRRGAVICLVAYVASTVPMLMIGSRADFVIAFLYAALYFVFRAVTDKNEVWITKRLVIACCVIAPLGIAAMGIMDYLRSQQQANLDFAGLVVDALYKQGVSFTIMGRAFDVNAQIQSLGFHFYSIGGLIETFTQGFIGQTFFGFPLLPSTNSYELATLGWSYSHAMSFFAHNNYLGGEGYGSSYILELFADFGYGGIAVGSFLLGCGLFALSHSLGRSWFWGMCALTSASHVFHMPRGYFDEWVSFLWSTRFLLALVLLVALAACFYFVEKRALAAKKQRALAGAHTRSKLGGLSVVGRKMA